MYTRPTFVISMLFIGAGLYAYYYIWEPALPLLIIWAFIFAIGIHDITQKKHTILRNFPVIGHFRYLLELIRPEIQQYFIENYENGMPFSREQRSVVYQRAKKVVDTLPFGTQRDLYAPGADWINHSITPTGPFHEEPRILIGEKFCKKPYSASLFNISAMSYGALSKNSVLALNKGAKMGGFYHNTGEGGISPYHKEYEADLVWQIGTGYFGCRTTDGRFDPERFKENSQLDQVKMIEIKISQGAKPGHGGILPAEKVTREISEIRGVQIGKTVISPPGHSAFKSPKELLEFICNLREYSGGKPVGFKLCVGKRREFFSICKAIKETQMYPDFITVDGAEGGTGAAPLEFSNSIGAPLNYGLTFVRNALVGTGIKEPIKVIASGKILTGFNIATKLSLGADLCNSSRGMMFALGCIQALRCNTNHCPTGVATQDPHLQAGLDVQDKGVRVYNYHKMTIESFLEVLGAAGLHKPKDLEPYFIHKRVGIANVKTYAEMYPFVEENDLLNGKIPSDYLFPWQKASADTFDPLNVES